MLIYSKERLLPANINMIVLAGEEGDYFYVHRSLFEQAVIIQDRYSDNIEALLKSLGVSEDAPMPRAVTTFVNSTPKPISLLGYFLFLIEDIDKLENEDIETLCGTIHIMSSVLNFRRFLKIPKEARAGVSFSLSIKEEYEVSWDRFFQEAIPYNYISDAPRVTFSPTSTSTVRETQVKEEVDAFESDLASASTDEDFIRLLDEGLDIDLDFSDDDNEDSSDEEEEKVSQEVVQEEPKAKSGLDLLRRL